MQSIRQVARLNDVELQKCIPPNASWHTDYRDTAYIYIGGLPFELSEGDILTLFSQYGNPVHIHLVRDKDTGRSRGFCFLKYEDQRSCDLAVDNLSGAGVLGRVVSVDHARYKMKEGEVETVGEGLEGEDEGEGDVTDREGEGRRKRRRRSGSGSDGGEGQRPVVREEVELARLQRSMDDDDPMKAYLIQEKQAEVAEAVKAVSSARRAKDQDRERKQRHRHQHHHHRSRRAHSDDEDEEMRDRHRLRHRSRRQRDHDDNSDDGAGRRQTRHDRARSPSRSRRERTASPNSDAQEDGRRPKSSRSRRERTATPESQDDDRPRRRRRGNSRERSLSERSRSGERRGR